MADGTNEAADALLDLPTLLFHHARMVTLRVVPDEAECAAGQQSRVAVHFLHSKRNGGGVIRAAEDTALQVPHHVVGVG